MGEFDLEGSVAAAWRSFQARLADHLAEMGDGDLLVVTVVAGEQDPDPAMPSLRFTLAGDGHVLRAEIGRDASATKQPWVDGGGAVMLTGQGWQPAVGAGAGVGPGAGPSWRGCEFFVDLRRDEADRLAFLAVRALRDALGVTHPVFLGAQGLEEDPDVLPVISVAEPAVEPARPLAVVPQSGEHLNDLVDEALEPLFGPAPERDVDGDIPIPWGSSLVYIRVHQSAPVIELFSFVVEHVADLERAAFEVAVLNRDHPFVKFLLVEDRVMAAVHLPAWPFAPDHLRATLTAMSVKLDEIDEDLVARVGGRLPLDDTPPHTPVDRPEVGVPDDLALQTILQLDAASGTRGVSPERAARVCGYDQRLVLRLITQTEAQECAWRIARDRARHAVNLPEMERCAKEVSAWTRTTALLRLTLALVVDHGPRPPRGAPQGGTPPGVAVEPPGAPRHGPHAAGAAEDP